jgi:hypothetical protein
MRLRRSKTALLERLAEPHREVRQLIQLDGFCWGPNAECDGLLHPDQDGDVLCAGLSDEIRASGEDLRVRVYIVPGTDPDVAVRVLHKLAYWILKKPELLTREDWEWTP